MPQWLIADEREKLRAFLERKPKINQISRYVFQIDKEIVDFSPVMPLPPEPKGMEAIEAAVFGWLANHDWAMKINDMLGKAALDKMRKSL